VGFVQVAQAYYNQRRSFTTAGAAEQTYVFYGAGLMGLSGHGAGLAIGANCTFRRAALGSIGGHGIGLAEDLITAIRLHGAGWRSIYLPEIVSRGLVPEDLGSYYRQQLKWARGVYEVFFSELPTLFGRLTWRQRLCYLTLGTYYFGGLTTGTYIVLPYLYLWAGMQAAAMPFSEFLGAGLPVAGCGIAMYVYVQRWQCDPAERGLHWRGFLLKIACWPIYTAGTLLAVLRADVPYLPTAKSAVRRRFVTLAWPHLLLMAVFVATLLMTLHNRLTVIAEGALPLSAEAVWGMLSFALLPVISASGAVYAAAQSTRPSARAAWDVVNSEDLGGDA
jgi:cellulose synthase (UDP-forming)